MNEPWRVMLTAIRCSQVSSLQLVALSCMEWGQALPLEGVEVVSQFA